MDEPVWQSLLRQAFNLIETAESTAQAPIKWSFGGGTVLMLRLNHRHSKDIDIFLADPQVLGFFNPRISEVAQDVSTAYEESSGHVKLYLPYGEIDFVVASPLLADPFEESTLLERPITLERSGEIIAKKMWHRGNLATARDLFDFAAVHSADPDAIAEAMPALPRNAATFLRQVETRTHVMRAEFDAIDRRDCLMTFDECQSIAESVLRPLVTPVDDDMDFIEAISVRWDDDESGEP